ncbi:MAG: hypothetical protein ACOCP4_06165 [Candidatus Woesearchaeota archaeon]
MTEEKLSEAQKDVLSLNRRLLIRGVLKHSVNVYDDDSLQDKWEFIIPSGMWSKQEDFIHNDIYGGKIIDVEPLKIVSHDYFIMAHTVYTEDETDEVHFCYGAKDFSLVKVLYYRESDILERIWQ